MQVPPVHYVDSGSGRVAYQVFGEGTFDLLAITQVSNIDAVWEHPGHLRVWRHLGGLARVIRLDPRGQGASDSIDQSAFGVDSFIDDITVVLDAVGSARVSISAEAWAAAVAVEFAVRHPDRVRNLVLVNGQARWLHDDDYPWGLRDDAAEQLCADVRSLWGSGHVIAAIAPHLAGPNREMLEFCARYERAIAGPTDMAAMLRAVVLTDVRSSLSQVATPVLVEHTGDITLTDISHSRYLAEHLPDARLLELESTSFYSGDPQRIEFERFLTGKVRGLGDRVLATVVFTDIVGSTERAVSDGDTEWKQTLEELASYVDHETARHHGTVVKSTGDGHLLTFPAPRDAVHAARRLRAGAHALGVSLRIGAHTGEIERLADGDVAGLAVHVAARVCGAAGEDEVLVSRTIADLLAGGGHDLGNAGTHTLKGVPGTWELFAVRP